MEGDTGLCLSCNEQFAKEGKTLTEKIMDAKSKISASKDAQETARLCQSIEDYGKSLVALHQAYNLQPSQELLDIIETYKKKGAEAGG
jgi:hypothetical protein